MNIKFFASAGIFCTIVFLPFFAKAEAPVNDFFANALPLTGAHLDVIGSNLEATVEPGEPESWFTDQTVWWSWVASSNGCVTLGTVGTGFPTDLNVYRGSDLNDLVKVSYPIYHTDGDQVVQRTRFDVEAGVLYYIQAKGFFWEPEFAGAIRFQLNFTDDTPVIFPDLHLETIVRSRLHKSSGVITRCDLLQIDYLVIDDPAVTNLTGLEWASELTSLVLGDLHLQNFSPIFSLTNLISVLAYNTPFTNLNVFTNLKAGSTLSLSECGVQDISALERLTNVATVVLFNNPVTNYASLAQATHLKGVNISFTENPIADLSIFLSFQSLTNLGISSSAVTDISPLLEMQNLKKLTLYDNPVTNYFLIGNLTNLESVAFNGTLITNLDFLAPLVHLRELELNPLGTSNLNIIGTFTNLESLGLFGIPLTNTSFFSNLTQIGYLQLQDNSLRDISFVQQLPKLWLLDLSYNHITNFSGLCGLTNLLNLFLTEANLDSLDFLQCGSTLLSLGIDGNRIKDISPLTNLIQLFSFSACGNLLTNIDAVAGFPGNAYLDLRTNLLDVRLGSQARTVINELIEKGATVKFTPQKTPPVFNAVPVHLSDGSISFQLLLNPGQEYEVQNSTNLFQWSTMTNLFSSDSPIFIHDENAMNLPRRFYRLVAH
jgi:hypothetical protein